MLYMMIEILISIVLLIPVFAGLNKVRFHNIKLSIFYFIFGAYLSAVYLLVGMPTLQFMQFELSLTLLPFLPMIDDLKNTILNMFLFIPLGISLPFLWTKYNTLKGTLLFGFIMSLTIELLQIFTYRATDINDIIANTFGAGLGYFIFSLTSHLIPSVKQFSKKKNEEFIIILSVFIVMFFIQPFIANFYYKIT